MSERIAPEAEDTISLLQEEIQRLEDELRLRDEALAEATRPADAYSATANAQSDGMHAELAAEIAKRDETIELLLEQVQLLEETDAARRAEWDQLQQWLDEVEQRVESQKLVQAAPDLSAELTAARHQAETQRLAAETDRRTWDSQRAALEKEVEQLRGKLAAVAQNAQGNAKAALNALEQENRRLRETCRDLERYRASQGELEYFREKYNGVLVELTETQNKLRETEDERQRERNEVAAEMAALRTQLARDAARRSSDPTRTDSDAQPQLSVDDRIRTLRAHLKEIHEHEEEERKSRTLSARISRLWRNTTPSR